MPARVLAIELVNATRGTVFASFQEPIEPGRTRGEIFRDLQREYGRCVSAVYVDRAEGGAPRRVGWAFQSRQRYTDARPGDRDPTYIREAWVQVVEIEHRETVIELEQV